MTIVFYTLLLFLLFGLGMFFGGAQQEDINGVLQDGDTPNLWDRLTLFCVAPWFLLFGIVVYPQHFNQMMGELISLIVFGKRVKP